MLRFDKMTLKAQEALQQAQEIAGSHQNQAVEPIHLLAALVEQADGVVPPLLARLGIRQEPLTQDVEREIERLPKVQGFAQQNLGRALNAVLERAFDEAIRFKDKFVPTKHILPAMSEQRPAPAGELLDRSGATHDAKGHA